MSAARAIVFDLGGVVVDWQPDRLVETATADAEMRRRLRSEIFDHPDWLQVDRGTLDPDEAVRRFAVRTGLGESEVAALVGRVPPSLVPKEATLALMRGLHAAGHSLYYLSNMGQPTFAYLQQHHDYWPLFAGGVVSYRVRLLKPEPAIFLHLLERYGLTARDTVFIDDMQTNVDAAAALGMTAIRFIDAEQCTRSLRDVLR